ncbi:TetR/AcrR family transcriptional regulator [Sinomonas soli]
MTVDTAPKAMAGIRDAAVRLFFEQGYEATTLRQIASAAGLKVGSLYYHITGKEALLADLMVQVLDDLMAGVRSAAEAESTPAGRLRSAVGAHIRFHAERAHEVFVGNTELRSLSGEARALVVAKREAYEEFFGQLIDDAAASGGADLIDPRVHLYSLMAQAAHVAGWYRSQGRMDLDSLGRAYSELALRGLGVPSEPPR